jgi:hypothetical protein
LLRITLYRYRAIHIGVIIMSEIYFTFVTSEIFGGLIVQIVVFCVVKPYGLFGLHQISEEVTASILRDDVSFCRFWQIVYSPYRNTFRH